MGLDDQDLKMLLAANLDTSFELFVLAYQRKLYVLVWYMIHHRQDAEDIVQDTFIRAYRALASLSSDEMQALKLRSWLFKIAYNLSLNYINRYAGFQSQLLSIDLPEGKDYFEGTALGQCPSPEVEIELREIRDNIYICVNQLSISLRIPILLHYITGLSYHEIAEVLHQPVNTVKSNGRRGLMKLQEMLKKQDERR